MPLLWSISGIETQRPPEGVLLGRLPMEVSQNLGPYRGNFFDYAKLQSLLQ